MPFSSYDEKALDGHEFALPGGTKDLARADFDFDFFNPRTGVAGSDGRMTQPGIPVVADLEEEADGVQSRGLSEVSTPELLSAASGLPPRPMMPEEFECLNHFILAGPQMADEALSGKLRGEGRGAYAKFALPSTGEVIHCCVWEGAHYITSFDMIKILKVLVIDDGSGRMFDDLIDTEGKKFEENVFSVLRQLKVGTGSQLEDSRSAMLDWLQRHDCIRTLKKQKVFFWHSVDFFALAREIRTRCLARMGIATPPPTPLLPGHPGMLGCQPFAAPLPLDPVQISMFTEAFMENLGQAATVNPADIDWASRAAMSLPVLALAQPFSPALGDATMRAPPPSPCGPYRQQTDFDPSRRYVCPEDGCFRWFKRREHMRRHRKTHTGERPHICPRDECQKTFSRLDNLSQHMRVHERDARPLAAP